MIVGSSSQLFIIGSTLFFYFYFYLLLVVDQTMEGALGYCTLFFFPWQRTSHYHSGVSLVPRCFMDVSVNLSVCVCMCAWECANRFKWGYL
jgi:hypothetical protein